MAKEMTLIKNIFMMLEMDSKYLKKIKPTK